MQPTTQATQSNLPTVEMFIGRLIAEKGITVTEPEILEQMKKDLMDRLEDKINATILLHMPEESMPEFSRKLDDASVDEIMAFANNVIPNLNEKIASAMLEFRTIYLG